MRIIITTGGTAGHIFPALATIEALLEKYAKSNILFVGTKTGLEEKLVTKAGIPFKALPVRGFMGKGIVSRIQSFFFLCYSLCIALTLFLKDRPHIVIGFGGYASFPSLLLAQLFRVPIILHEQNSIPGTVTKSFARFAKTICVTFESTKQYFPNSNVVYTGNPLRSSLVLSEEKIERISSTNILIMGGSLGASYINTIVVAIAPLLLKKGFHLWHQTGIKHYSEVMQMYKERNIEHVRVSPFIETMQEAYSWADFAICRAGATTITELAIMAVPAIFIPFPYAIHNHQYHNAKAVLDAQAGLCLEESTITDVTLLQAIEYIVTVPVLYTMKKNIHAFVKNNAADEVVKQIEAYI